jgi:hypothetical protein
MLEGKPVTISVTSRIAGVMMRGRWFERRALDSLRLVQ